MTASVLVLASSFPSFLGKAGDDCDIMVIGKTTFSVDVIGFGTGLFILSESLPPDDRNSGPEVLPVKDGNFATPSDGLCLCSNMLITNLISKSAQHISILSTSDSKFEFFELGIGRAYGLVITRHTHSEQN